jgi:uncharacterized membrane protein YraQ (UPF0718 family)
MELDRIVPTFAEAMLWNAAQFAVGGVAAVVLGAAFRGNLPRSLRRTAGAGSAGHAVFLIVLFAALGSVLPLGTYGIVPMVALLAAAGLGVPASVAFLCSNRFFNMLIPFADPSFVWRSGYGRAFLAVAAGIAAGLLFLNRGDGPRGILRTHTALPEDNPRLTARTAAALIGALAWKAAIALAVGSILDILFRTFIRGGIVGFLFSNPVTGPLASSFGQRNAANSFFLRAMWCVTVVTDFIGLSGLALVVKARGLALYVGYCAALAALLGASTLIP